MQDPKNIFFGGMPKAEKEIIFKNMSLRGLEKISLEIITYMVQAMIGTMIASIN